MNYTCSQVVHTLFTVNSRSIDSLFARVCGRQVLHAFWRYGHEAQPHQDCWSKAFIEKESQIPGHILAASALDAGKKGYTFDEWLMALMRALASVTGEQPHSEPAAAASPGTQTTDPEQPKLLQDQPTPAAATAEATPEPHPAAQTTQRSSPWSRQLLRGAVQRASSRSQRTKRKKGAWRDFS